MGRPPSSGAPAFRFLPSEVAEMEARLQQLNNTIPGRDVLQSLADKFSASPERAGRAAIQPKQVWNWFQNRRYSHRAKSVRPAPPPPSKMAPSGADRLQHATTASAFRAAQTPAAAAAGAHPGSSPAAGAVEGVRIEYEAKSARDGAWYDVASFLSHRMFEPGDPEGKEQALYFDAIVLDAQRRRHDIRGCRCRFLVRYNHDESEEIVPLRKVCRRPETNYRLQMFHASRAAATPSADVRTPPKQIKKESASNEKSPAEEKPLKQHKMRDVKTDEVTVVSDHEEAAGNTARPTPSAQAEAHNDSTSDVAMDTDPAPVVEVDDEVQVVDKVKEDK